MTRDFSLRPGSAACACDACGERFTSISAFDEHRTGPFEQNGRPHQRRCRTAAEMIARGMVRNDRGYWTTSKAGRLADYRQQRLI